MIDNIVRGIANRILGVVDSLCIVRLSGSVLGNGVLTRPRDGTVHLQMIEKRPEQLHYRGLNPSTCRNRYSNHNCMHQSLSSTVGLTGLIINENTRSDFCVDR